MLVPATRIKSHRIAGLLLGFLLILASVCMFFIAHHHHALLRKEISLTKLGGRPLQGESGSDVVDKIYDGSFISNVLSGSEPFPAHNRNERQQLKFLPGTLAMNSAEALQHCYVDMGHYRDHFDKLFSVQVSVADKYKLIYRNVPKSASSSSRHIMKDFFGGEDSRLKHRKLNEYVLNHNYTLVSFIRDPLDRFYSSYDEAFLRMGPWWGAGEFVHEKPALHRLYESNKHKVEPYPYLYEGMKTMEDFRKLYCPSELLEQNYILCNDANTIDDGDLTRRFEQFVRDYDGRKPFDSHLRLQVAFLVYNSRLNGAPLPITYLYNASEADKGWSDIANDKGIEIPKEDMVFGRKSSRRFNLNLVSNETKRKICQIVALDYCCLNLKLPEACKFTNDSYDGVFCVLEKWDRVQDQHTSKTREIVIHSGRRSSNS
ncbi:hypothetical protein HJC23_003094 [Cyclotella cryptica]|uniref:Sulfotransferase domain-containing protein n=1 Tax=Cyclotella cryptica TaxID=29204 RepID=A0ABD3P4E9_9STRA|eukprot:CCRYP_017656-RA/>CCRYP_017656-RA protein AED:0.46 eAED:0.44 QI:0/-1/0/1/-1/1/1/0/429